MTHSKPNMARFLREQRATNRLVANTGISFETAWIILHRGTQSRFYADHNLKVLTNFVAHVIENNIEKTKRELIID